MTKRRAKSWALAAMFGPLVWALGIAHADTSKGVQKAFRGDILITPDALPDTEGMSDSEAIKELKRASLKKVKGTPGDDVKAWTFYYTAFLKKPAGVKDVRLDFHKTDKEKTYAANQRLVIDPSLTIITGRLTIDENEGPNPGTTYDVILRGKKAGKEIDLARTRVTLE